jgi:hypothetical protein
MVRFRIPPRHSLVQKQPADGTRLQNGFANLPGVIAPALTGFAVDRTGSVLAAMAITAGVSVAGGLAWVFVGRTGRRSDAL